MSISEFPSRLSLDIQIDPSSCLGCNQVLESPTFCFQCNQIQAQKSDPDFFSLFSIPHSFIIDEEAINDQFDELMIVLHPDYYVDNTAEEQALSLRYTSLLNKGKGILLNPFERGKHLLATLSPRHNQIPKELPQEFIIEMFELQEELDEIEEEKGDIGALEEQILQVTKENNEFLTLQFATYARAPQEKLLPQIQEALGKLKFFLNLQARVEQIKASL